MCGPVGIAGDTPGYPIVLGGRRGETADDPNVGEPGEGAQFLANRIK